jgi:hypothetical protein
MSSAAHKNRFRVSQLQAREGPSGRSGAGHALALSHTPSGARLAELRRKQAPPVKRSGRSAEPRSQVRSAESL